MIRRPPRSTRTDTLLPYTTLFRSVIGIPDEKWGETVKAVVVAKPGATADEADIIAWARERIAPFKCPRSIDLIDALPRNASGKILRKDLRAPYWEGYERMVN